MIAIGASPPRSASASALLIDWFPVDASKQAEPIDTLYDVLMIVSVPVFVLVVSSCSTPSGSSACARARRTRTGRRSTATPGSRSSGRRSRRSSSSPLCSLRLRGAARRREVEGRHAGDRRLRPAVRVDLPVRGPDGKAFSVNQLYLPCTPTGGSSAAGAPCRGRPIKFSIRAVDVIHSFWVPAFRDEAGRGAGDRHHPARPRRRSSAPTPSSAPSCAARPRDHALDRPRRSRSLRRWLARRAPAAPAVAAAAAAPRRRLSRSARPRRRGHHRHDGPRPRQVLRADEADPTASSTRTRDRDGYREIMPPTSADPLGRARRAGRLLGTVSK